MFRGIAETSIDDGEESERLIVNFLRDHLQLYTGHYQKMEESRKTKSLKISVKFFNLAATFIPNIHEGTNIQNMRSLTRRIIGQLIILCLLLRLKCQCSHKQTFYH